MFPEVDGESFDLAGGGLCGVYGLFDADGERERIDAMSCELIDPLSGGVK